MTFPSIFFLISADVPRTFGKEANSIRFSFVFLVVVAVVVVVLFLLKWPTRMITEISTDDSGMTGFWSFIFHLEKVSFLPRFLAISP